MKKKDALIDTIHPSHSSDAKYTVVIIMIATVFILLCNWIPQLIHEARWRHELNLILEHKQ